VRSCNVASSIIVKNYEASTDANIELIANYYSLVLDSIDATAYDIVADDTLVNYLNGKYEEYF